MAHPRSPGTGEAELGRKPRVLGQPGLQKTKTNEINKWISQGKKKSTNNWSSLFSTSSVGIGHKGATEEPRKDKRIERHGDSQKMSCSESCG